MNTLELGSHIFTVTTDTIAHGIYLGDNCVLHYPTPEHASNQTWLQRSSLEAFVNNKQVGVRHYKKPMYTGKAVIKRLHSKLAKNKYTHYGYHCEQFCAWAITGQLNTTPLSANTDFADVIISKMHTTPQQAPLPSATIDPIDLSFKTLVFIIVPGSVSVFVIYKTFKWLFKKG
ncbi:MAG: lecithin retinol acyltransferase family protein [Methylovulum sp.]|jgi:hypothetical protein|nr:lecithin retinol acyltransferase family protein [Methylovulum sp.]